MIKVLRKIANILFKASCIIRRLSDKADELAYFKKIKKEKGYSKKEWQEIQKKNSCADSTFVINTDNLCKCYENLGATTRDLIAFRLGAIKGTFDKWKQDINIFDKGFKGE